MDEVQAFDLLSEDNSLLTSSSPDCFLHHDFSEHKENNKKNELLKDTKAIAVGDIPDNCKQDELLPQPCESLEPEIIKKNSKCNMRKSLAWDSAFFTSEGFLEPEELSSMIEGVDKGRKNLLPSIQEDDIQRSMDSLSTLDSDNLTLESLEADLFQDIRASIQKSSKAFSAANLSRQPGAVEKSVQTNQDVRKSSLATQNKLKPKLISALPSAKAQGPGKTMERPTCQQFKLPVVRVRDSTLSLPKIPKALGKACPIPTTASKRASLNVSANSVKLDKDNSKSSAAAGNRVSSSRAPVLAGSRSGVPRPTPSSASSTAIKSKPVNSFSSLDSTKKVGKSPSNSVKKLPDSKPIKTLPSISKVALRNKSPLGSSNLSASLKSSINSSSGISPSSSIGEWSCESSSSSISTVKQQYNNVMASVDSSSSFKGVLSTDHDSPHAQKSHYKSNDQFSVGDETNVSACPVAKPSGLRMPSPKIGFFDGVKSVVRTPRGGMQSPSSTSLRRYGPSSSNSSGTPINLDLRNAQPASAVTSIKNTHHVLESPSIKVPSIRKAVRNCPEFFPKVVTIKSSEKSLLKNEEGKNEEEHMEAKRFPFAVNNSLRDNEEVFEYSKGTMVGAAEKTIVLPILEIAEKENN